jgi:hypothetical protein
MTTPINLALRNDTKLRELVAPHMTKEALQADSSAARTASDQPLDSGPVSTSLLRYSTKNRKRKGSKGSYSNLGLISAPPLKPLRSSAKDFKRTGNTSKKNEDNNDLRTLSTGPTLKRIKMTDI